MLEQHLPQDHPSLFVNLDCKSNTVVFFTLWLAGFLLGLPICPFSPRPIIPWACAAHSLLPDTKTGPCVGQSGVTLDTGIRLAVVSWASAAFSFHTLSWLSFTFFPHGKSRRGAGLILTVYPHT